MTNLAVNLAVEDVRLSVDWYSKLLNCHSPMEQEHPHRKLFDLILDENNNTIVIFSQWGHNKLKPLANKSHEFTGLGVHLFFEVENINQSWENANDLKVDILHKLHKSRGFNNLEFTVMDRDGYYVTISEKNKTLPNRT